MKTLKKTHKNFPKTFNIINENYKLIPKKLKENENGIKLYEKKNQLI